MSTHIMPRIGKWLLNWWPQVKQTASERPYRDQDPENRFRGALSGEPTAEEIERVDRDLNHNRRDY